MKNKLHTILLVDDDDDDNFFHSIVIEKMNIADKIDVAHNGIDALNYLKNDKNSPPDIIFLDINMPKMNGWEFLEQYKNLNINQKSKVLIVILTTSANPDDIKRAKEIEGVTDFSSKPLSEEFLTNLLEKHFQTDL